MSKVRIISLGGLSNVTKNMYIYEYWEGEAIKDILLVDCGVGFSSHLEPLGIDSVIPDVSYLLDKKHLIRALVITHGHEDHIGAVPHIVPQLDYPPIYAPKLAALLMGEKMKELKDAKVRITTVNLRQDYIFGAFKVRHINMTHSIPDTTHLFIETPVGNLYHGADYKFDLTPVYGNPPDFEEIVRAGKLGVKLLLSDALGSEREGYTLSEKVVGATLDDEMRMTKGRFFMTTFASNISRIKQCVEAAVKYNRKLCFIGRSMKRNMEIALQEGYIKLSKDAIIPEEKLKSASNERLCVILTGSQGEFSSALEKVATGRHRFIKLQKSDRILFSSDPIPGNEVHIQDVLENIIEQGADVIYTAIRDQLHTSGHGSQEDHKLLVRLTKPEYLMPIGTTVKHSRAYSQVMKQLGYKDEDMFAIHSGEPLIIEKAGRPYKGEKIELKEMLVDGGSVGDVDMSILKERERLGQEGVVIVAIKGVEVNVMSRGLVFGDKNTLAEIKQMAVKLVDVEKNPEVIEKKLTTDVTNHMQSTWQKNPEIVILFV